MMAPDGPSACACRGRGEWEPEEDFTPDDSHEAYVDFNQWEPTEE